MFASRSNSLLPMAGSALLLLLTGCATEKTLTAQTQPLQAQIARVEQAVSASASTSELREQTGQIATRLTGLEQQDRTVQAETQALREQVEILKTRQAAEADARARLEDRLARSEQRVAELSNLVTEAMALAAKDIFLANGKEAFTLNLTGDKVLYPQNDPYVDPRDAALLDDLARRLIELDQEYHLDIQGHTDNFSTDDNNYNLGKARSEVIKRYLHEKKGISLNRMSAISYGANKPIDKFGGNNRRIYIRVLVLK